MPASGACLYFSGGGKSTVDNTVSNQKQLCHHSGEATFKSQFKVRMLFRPWLQQASSCRNADSYQDRDDKVTFEITSNRKSGLRFRPTGYRLAAFWF